MWASNVVKYVVGVDYDDVVERPGVYEVELVGLEPTTSWVR